MPKLHHGGSLDESGAIGSEECKLGALIVKGFPSECKGIVKNEKIARSGHVVAEISNCCCVRQWRKSRRTRMPWIAIAPATKKYDQSPSRSARKVIPMSLYSSLPGSASSTSGR